MVPGAVGVPPADGADVPGAVGAEAPGAEGAVGADVPGADVPGAAGVVEPAADAAATCAGVALGLVASALSQLDSRV